jgi:hypothetical protein
MSNKPQDDICLSTKPAFFSGKQSPAVNFSKIDYSCANGKSVRIGVISDTHIPDREHHLPQVILDNFKRVDLIAHAGDIVSLGVIEELKNVCPKVLVVAGNMDQETVKKKYPQKQVLEIAGYKVGLIHGAGPAAGLPDLIQEAFKKDGCDLIIFGHSHKPMNDRVNGILLFNPGSATDLSAAYNSYGIINLKKRPLGPGQKDASGIEAEIIRI